MSRRSTIVAACMCFSAVSSGAQSSEESRNARVMFVNDEWERYTRVLQVIGDVRPYPWSSRGFGPLELRQLRPITEQHPWSARARDRALATRWYSVGVLPAEVQAIFNSDFPYGYNDGPVWAGRGVTTVVNGGLYAAAGPLSVPLAPVFFRAENRAFALQPNGMSGDYRFGDQSVVGIDQPQRFGDASYERLDPGNTTIRLDIGPAAVGFSTASLHWGPARDHPIVLGNNAGGFSHYFAGSTTPWDLKIAKVHGRFFWGRLNQSRYSPMREVAPWRYTTGLVGTIVPRGAPGLEIGAGRFFHVLWSDSVFSRDNLIRPLTGILKKSRASPTNPSGSEPDNQLATVFGRWVFPESGFEVYGEYGRDDHNQNFRDLFSEPDHMAAYVLGFQHVWRGRSAERRSVARGEILNTRMSGLHLARGQVPFYIHSPVSQGHTSNGQVLGSAGGFGGGASVLGFDSYSSTGRWSISWARIMRAQALVHPSGMPEAEHADVMHTLGIDGIRFRGRLALTYELTTIFELNRDFGRDAWNVRAATGAQYVW